ncbi:MAG: sulfatase-like hydrolase/transferase [Planctomycetales bacterium]|nr:sulfatase-like hydrolase/transferase [Planctomycetales bacterium]
MRRRVLHNGSLSARLAFVVVALVCQLDVAGAREAGRPNVIVIVADDLGYADVGFNGCRDIPTPHLDALAAEGVRFTNGYVTFPVCSPSRAGLITGRYQQRFGHERNPIYNPADDQMGLPLTETTLADVLGSAGYVSGAIGKWHLGAHDVFHPLNRGFNEFFGFLTGGHEYFPDRWTLRGGGFHWEGYRTLLQRDWEFVEEKEYLTDALSREAVAFVRRHRDEPFFLYLCYNAPHTPLQAPQETLEKFRHIRNEKRRTYAAMVSVMDDGVGRLLAELDALDLDEQTLVFFLSDNGGPENANASDNGPLRGQKGDVFEGGIRVPFVVRWRGVVPARDSYEEPVSALDIFATAATQAGALASIPIERPIDGVDLTPFLTGRQAGPPHDSLYWRSFDRGAWAIRTGAEKLLRPRRDEEQLLFNLEQDLSESTNQSSERPGDARQLESSWREWEQQMIDPAFLGLESIKQYRKQWQR